MFLNTNALVSKESILLFLFLFILESKYGVYGEFGATSNALLFSLRNKEGLKPFQSMVKEPSKAIYNYRFWGPTFGKYDLLINRVNGRSSTNLGECYSVPSEVRDNETVLAGTQEFEPDEVEVFYLV